MVARFASTPKEKDGANADNGRDVKAISLAVPTQPLTSKQESDYLETYWPRPLVAKSS